VPVDQREVHHVQRRHLFVERFLDRFPFRFTSAFVGVRDEFLHHAFDLRIGPIAFERVEFGFRQREEGRVLVRDGDVAGGADEREGHFEFPVQPAFGDRRGFHFRQLHLDADFAELLLDQQRHLLEVVGAGRVLQADREALGEFRFRHFFLGFFDVVFERFDFLVGSVEFEVLDDAVRHRADTPEHGAVELFAVDRQAQRAADMEVVQSRDFRVRHQQDLLRQFDLLHREAGFALQRFDLRERDAVGDLGFTAFQRQDPGVRVGDEVPPHRLQVGLALFEEVGVLFEADVRPGREFLEFERTGADRVFPEGGAFGFQLCFVDDEGREDREVVEERGDRVFEFYHHRRVVRRLGAFHTDRERRQRRVDFGVAELFEVPGDVGAADRRAVGVFEPWPEVEGVGQPVRRDVPFFGEAGDDFVGAAGIVADEAVVEHFVGEDVAVAVLHFAWIQGDGFQLARVDQRAAAHRFFFAGNDRRLRFFGDRHGAARAAATAGADQEGQQRAHRSDQ
jgi:hypothetical protein